MPSLQAVLLLLGSGGVQARESWDAIYLAGSKTGFIHTFVQKVPDRGREYLRVRIDIEYHAKRQNDVAVTKMMYGTIETPDGQVLRLDTRTQAGGRDLRAHGDVVQGRMKLTLEGAGHSESLVIPWGPDVRGPYAPEQSMARKPMKEHEERTLKMFIPDLNKVCTVRLQARRIEPVMLGDGNQHPLLRVDQTTIVDGQPRPELDARVYVDDEGQVLKSEQDVFGGIVIYRTTKQAATSPNGPIQVDVIENSVIKVAHKIPNPDQTQLVRYRVTLKDSDPAEVIPSDARQTLQPAGGGNAAILEVRALGPLDGTLGPAEVDPKYLKPNALVTSEDTRVRSLAQRVTRGVEDPWEKATRINQWVFSNIRERNFKVAFAAASDVARDLTGDCTEHAVLAAAMCRAVGVPARIALGIIYVDRLGGFGYHMWNEVYVNRRWVALDASWDQSTVDAVHIKLSESSLEGVAPLEAFLPFARVAGKLAIEPIELR
jgi:transglutaminase-like putative cysteine protease